jgi:hypothetical protein
VVVLGLQFLLVKSGGLPAIILVNVVISLFGIQGYMVYLNLKSLNLGWAGYVKLLLRWPGMLKRILRAQPGTP